jgi:hypothetical protein
MSTTSAPVQSPPQPIGTRFRNAAIATLFAFVLLIPRILHLRRNAHSWILFRILLGVAGAALVVLPLGLGNSYVLSVAGLVMFISSILLPPTKPRPNVDDKARELGAFVVVNGGRYQSPDAPPATVQLFICAERIWALDPHCQPLLVLSVNEITLAHAEQSQGGWLLSIHWADRSAEFTYRGIFAEHLARIAETTLRSVIRPSPSAARQRRAAGA